MRKLILTFLLTFTATGVLDGQSSQQKPRPQAQTASPAVIATPTVDQIIDKYVRALGGLEAINKLSTRVRKGEAEIVGLAGKGEVEEYTKAPNELMAKLTLPPLVSLQYGYDGKNGWRREPSAGLVSISGIELTYLSFDSAFNKESRLRERYPKLELKGLENVNGRDTYLVIGTPVGLNPEKLYFDRQSGLLVRLDTARATPAGEVIELAYFEDYRDVDGVKVPFAETHKAMGLTFIFRFTWVKHNLPIDDATFKMAGAQVREKQLNEAKRLNKEMATLYSDERFDDAIPLARRAVAILAEILGPRDPSVATYLNNLAVLYILKSDFSRAEPLLERALSIYEEAYDPKHPDVASALHALGLLYEKEGNYARAEPLLERALSIRKEVFGPKHSDIVTALSALGLIYDDEGKYAQAQLLLEQALVMAKEVFDPKDPEIARVMNLLGLLYRHKGDYRRAEALFNQAVAISEQAHDPKHLGVATYLNNLAALYEIKEDYAHAELLHKRVLAIYELAFGRKDLNVATSLNNLALLYFDRNDYVQALPLFQEALAIRKEVLGANHPDIATILNNLAVVYRNQGDYARAATLYKQTLAIREAALPPQHPDIASTLTGLALLYANEGDYAHAKEFLTRANKIHEYNLTMILTIGSQKQKQLYLDTVTAETYVTVSLHVRFAQQDHEVTQMALTTILRRKGRPLDVMTDQIGSLRRHASPQMQAEFDELAAAGSHLATLQFSGGGKLTPEARREEIVRLTAEVERLENELSSHSAKFRRQVVPIRLDDVRRTIPADAALVEVFWYRPYNMLSRSEAEKWSPPRYVAYVLRRNLVVPQWVDLGEAATIDKEVQRLRAALRNPKRDVHSAARAVDKLVMQPIRQLLRSTRRVFISPDGSLDLIPFAALVDENGEYLVKHYSLTYLTSGRDVLRLQNRTESRGRPVVIADPLYDSVVMPDSTNEAINQQPDNNENRRSSDFALPNYDRLRGTAEEAALLGKLFPDARLLTKDKATESAAKKVRGPRILHIATHGFFLPDQESWEITKSAGLSAQEGQGVRTENPMLRSGLVLTGANKLQGGNREDGILTALEASGLDLQGTLLVVLSACDAGLGNVQNGNGVYGLRRALVLAGSESQVISLWKITDKVTRDLIVAYYKRLKLGQGRGEALRQVQLEMLNSADRSHPYFWASFIASGDWRSLNRKRSF